MGWMHPWFQRNSDAGDAHVPTGVCGVPAATAVWNHPWCGTVHGVRTHARGEAQRVCEAAAPPELTREGSQSDMCGTWNRWPSGGSCPPPVVAQANMRVTARRFLL